MTKREKVELLQKRGFDITYENKSKGIVVSSLDGVEYKGTKEVQNTVWTKIDELIAELPQEVNMTDSGESTLPFMKELPEYDVSKERLLEIINILTNYSHHIITYTETPNKIVWEHIDGRDIKKDKWTQNWATGMILALREEWIDAITLRKETEEIDQRQCAYMGRNSVEEDIPQYHNDPQQRLTGGAVALDWEYFRDKILNNAKVDNSKETTICTTMEDFRVPAEDSMAMDWDDFNELILDK